ncbi:hypothetical protein HNY73_011832 [Argiope bruennichi]|uniref:Uncharacterized protein n=1 Tax=Argiope bruennichi TaxID=94029 RepID=A0A8T0EXH7_ARGBR|nr:hypothetical protein HNY73_011832 [Argiope bruennichi]
MGSMTACSGMAGPFPSTVTVPPAFPCPRFFPPRHHFPLRSCGGLAHSRKNKRVIDCGHGLPVGLDAAVEIVTLQN